MALADYHNHTTFCGHATGTMDQYMESAAAKGIKEIGFSDHAPVPELFRPGISMRPDETETYIHEIEKRKRESTSIAVKVGFELDYPLLESFDRRYLADPRIDYFIGSCHILDGWLFDHPDHTAGFARRDINQVYRRYYQILKSMAASGYFNIVGHFDVVKKFGHRPTESMAGPVTEVLAEMAANGIALEINTAGLLKPVAEIYPSEEIVRLAFGLNVPVTLGSDSHAPENVGYAFSEAVDIIKKAGYRKISGFAQKSRYDINL